jgi:hypothetical protein
MCYEMKEMGGMGSSGVTIRVHILDDNAIYRFST